VDNEGETGFVMKSKGIFDKIKLLPLGAGVYIMKSKRKEILYIGKATCLRRRVNSHFSSRSSLKNSIFLESVCDVDYIECSTPEQALILEAALIKERKPRYNIALRDNKSYSYIGVTREKFPRIFITRLRKKTSDFKFGPYPKAGVLKSALMLIRKVFPYRSCKTIPRSACLFFHLKLCPAPCAGNIDFLDYKANIENICKILKGERKRMVKGLENKMNRLAKKENFEEAAEIRDKLLAIDNLYKGRPKVHEIISLKEILNLPQLPLVIEAIDISSLGSRDSAGSVVVFKDGVSDKNSYRRFLIKEVKEQDDYSMIREVVRRRYSRLVNENSRLPDLVVIDGGRGHVRAAKKELDSLDLKIPLIGIAKRNEEIWFFSRSKPLVIPKDSPCLHLIQRIRDEAHRFAHKYHILRREKRR